MVICASVFPENWGGDFTVRSLRSRGGEIPAFAHSARVVEHVSTTKTFLRFSIAASAQQMHLLLPILVLCRRYSAEYFSPCAPHRSLREPLLQLRCHHLALATQLALAQKSTFIKISLPLHLPNPPRVKDQRRTKDEPRNTQRTPNHQKVLFIKIGYLKEIFVTVASAICLPCQMPLSISFTPLCKVSLHSRTSAKMSHR